MLSSGNHLAAVSQDVRVPTTWTFDSQSARKLRHSSPTVSFMPTLPHFTSKKAKSRVLVSAKALCLPKAERKEGYLDGTRCPRDSQKFLMKQTPVPARKFARSQTEAEVKLLSSTRVSIIHEWYS